MRFELEMEDRRVFKEAFRVLGMVCVRDRELYRVDIPLATLDRENDEVDHRARGLAWLCRLRSSQTLLTLVLPWSENRVRWPSNQ